MVPSDYQDNLDALYDRDDDKNEMYGTRERAPVQEPAPAPTVTLNSNNRPEFALNKWNQLNLAKSSTGPRPKSDHEYSDIDYDLFRERRMAEKLAESAKIATIAPGSKLRATPSLNLNPYK